MDGTKKPEGAVDFKTCDQINDDVNKMLMRTKYLSSIIPTYELEWNKNFERSRTDKLYETAVTEVVKGVQYLRTGDGRYIHVLPPDVDDDSLTGDILQRMQDCGVFNHYQECRYKADVLDRVMDDREHATQLANLLRIQPVPQGFQPLQEDCELEDDDARPNQDLTNQSLGEVLTTWSEENCKRIIQNPFKCWLRSSASDESPGALFRVIPYEVRFDTSWGTKTCKETFLYSRPYFYCSSLTFTRLMPYKPAIGFYVDEEMTTIRKFLFDTIRDAAMKHELTPAKLKRVTHELWIQYFTGREDDANRVVGFISNNEENNKIHDVFESVLYHEIWCTEMCPPVGRSIYDLLDPTSPVFRADLREEILRTAPNAMRGDEDEIITGIINQFARFVDRSTGGLRREGTSWEAWDVTNAFRQLKDATEARTNDLLREYFPQFSISDVRHIFRDLTWLRDVPDTVYIPIPDAEGELVRPVGSSGRLVRYKKDRAVYRGSIRRRAYSTQTQCCLNLERTRSSCTLTGYDEQRHSSFVKAFTDNEHTSVSVDGKNVHVRAHKRYADLMNVVTTLQANEMTLVEGSMQYLVTHTPRIIADAVPNNSSVSITGLSRSMRREYESERDFAIRSASIHPDMICFNVTVDNTTSNRARNLLADIANMKALGIWSSGTWQEKLGFGAIFIQLVDSVTQMVTALFGDRVSLIESFVSWILGAFDNLVDAIQSLGPGDSIWQLDLSSGDDADSGGGLLGRAFSNVFSWDTDESFAANAADKGTDLALETVQAAVHTAHAAQNPVDFIMNLMKMIPGFDTWGTAIEDFVENILTLLVNPLQILFLVPKLQRIVMNMYNSYDRKRLQHIRQHTLTYASFVRHLAGIDDVTRRVKLDMRSIDEETQKPVFVVLGARMSQELLKWSRRPSIKGAGYSSIMRTYYRDSPQKCFIHNRRRCNDCNKEVISFADAVNNIARTLKRLVEWGLMEEDVESEVVRLRERVRELEMKT